jgi:serine/threonine-protein phosphatase 2B catalytic subunit
MQIARINAIQRICEVPIANVLYCDLIWSDPVENDTGYLRNRSIYNFSRDCSIVFGATLAYDFLRENKLSTIIRAHEVYFEGYNLHRWNSISSVPPVITVFSAPNYCGSYNNKGAILTISVPLPLPRKIKLRSNNSKNKSLRNTNRSTSTSSAGPWTKL